MNPGLLILMVCCSPLDFVQKIESEKDFSHQPNIKEEPRRKRRGYSEAKKQKDESKKVG